MTKPRGVGRPRSAEADGAILQATLELLVHEGLRGVSIERVATAADVAKTTIYRRYRSKSDLVVAALGLLAFPASSALPDTGTSRGDYLELIRGRFARAPASRWNLLMPRLVVDSAGDPELRELVDRLLVVPGRERIGDILRRGIARGELAQGLDVELATDVLVGPLVYRLLVARGEIHGIRSLPDRLFELVESMGRSDH